MGKTVTLELPEEVYDAVSRAAAQEGRSAAEWIGAQVGEQQPPGRGPSATDAVSIRSEFGPMLWSVLEDMARRDGVPVVELALDWRARYGQKPRPPRTDAERQASHARLMRHAGAANLGHPTGADNESIDADLAREYGSRHEEEPA